MTSDFYIEFLESFREVTKKPTFFLQADEDFCDCIKLNMKKLYDFTKREEFKRLSKNVLQQLVVQNFDTEQIWQQIELQNDSLISSSVPLISRLAVNKSNLLFEKQDLIPIIDESNDTDGTSDESFSESSEPVVNDDLVEKFEVDQERRSIVDDDFFKLHEMEKFLNAEEKGYSDSGNDSDNSEDEGSIDLFEENLSGDDDDTTKTIRYKDFFGTRNEITEDPVDKEWQTPSSFELVQNRLNKTIEDIEKEAITDKSWQLKGEITADNRPQNSLLEEVVEFDLTTRPAPIITEQTSLQLEDVIKQRIKDRVFDSVERKLKPVETPLEYRKKLVLDQEKSKQSLAQIYEQEFLKQQASMDNAERDENEPQIHLEINKMIGDLFIKLDALSNFHFTPKPAVAELKIISNLPAIGMEEVAPVAVSEAALLAPEEVKGRSKGDVIGKNERTRTDKNRERRKKKIKQKIHAKRKQGKEGTANINNKTQKKSKTVEKGGESLDRVKSSKAFFSQLEDQVKSQISKRKSSTTTKNDKCITSAKKLKL